MLPTSTSSQSSSTSTMSVDLLAARSNLERQIRILERYCKYHLAASKKCGTKKDEERAERQRELARISLKRKKMCQNSLDQVVRTLAAEQGKKEEETPDDEIFVEDVAKEKKEIISGLLTSGVQVLTVGDDDDDDLLLQSLGKEAEEKDENKSSLEEEEDVDRIIKEMEEELDMQTMGIDSKYNPDLTEMKSEELDSQEDLASDTQKFGWFFRLAMMGLVMSLGSYKLVEWIYFRNG